MQFELNTIKKWEYQFGCPLYIFDEGSFRRNYIEFDTCFKKIYPKYTVSYSYKTNYTPYICKIVRELGGYAEVVSDMEMEIARIVGNDYNKIVYNGPYKGPMAIKLIKEGGIVNIDNFDELEKIIDYSKNNPNENISIGLRINIDIGQGFISRFGIDECEIDKVFKLIEKINNIHIIGFHCHIGRSRNLISWENRAKTMIMITKKYLKEPKYISLGSGMYGRMDSELSKQFASHIPTYNEYAKTVATQFANNYNNQSGPILFTEPGTTLINKYISLISKVEAIKKIKGKSFIVLNCSKHNIGEICELKQLPLTIIHTSNNGYSVDDADIVGYTCLEHDVMYRNFYGKVAVGDYIVFDNVGGYSIVSKPPFIRPNCSMITLTGKIIKRAETIKEIIATYE
jgi:diaminopimelate decarboxylase